MWLFLLMQYAVTWQLYRLIYCCLNIHKYSKNWKIFLWLMINKTSSNFYSKMCSFVKLCLILLHHKLCDIKNFVKTIWSCWKQMNTLYFLYQWDFIYKHFFMLVLLLLIKNIKPSYDKECLVEMILLSTFFARFEIEFS